MKWSHGAAVVLAAVSLAACSSRTDVAARSPEDVATAFVQAVGSGDCDTATALSLPGLWFGAVFAEDALEVCQGGRDLLPTFTSVSLDQVGETSRPSETGDVDSIRVWLEVLDQESGATLWELKLLRFDRSEGWRVAGAPLPHELLGAPADF